MNILYLITSLDYGGTQKNLLELAKFSVERGNKVSVVALKKDGIYEQKFAAAGISVASLELPNFSVNFFLKFPGAISKLIRLVRNSKAEIIHSFLFQANILGRIVAKICGIKNISSIRVMEIEKKFQRFISLPTNFMVDKFTVNSTDLMEFVIKNEKVPPDKIVYIPNYFHPSSPSGKDARMEFGISKNDFLLSAVGRLEKQKGFKYLIDAVNLLKEDIPQLKLLLVGDGSLRQKLESQIKKLNLESKVILTGYREDTADIIASSDVFVLSSLWEGSPNVVLEAVNLRKPVVSTSVSGVCEIIEHKYLVPPGNTVELAKKILYVYKNISYARFDAEKSAERLIKFTAINNLERYIELYKSL